MTAMALLGGDRSRSLHFAGREHELEALHTRLDFLVKEQDPEDGIVLIDGIQGIGKTGLLREFARQAVSSGGHYGGVEIVHLPLVAEELGVRPADLVLGFPQHLHGYVRGCLDALDKFGTLDADGAKEWAMAEGDKSRLAYYEGRLQSFTPDEGIVLSQIAALASRGDGRIPWHDATRAAEAAGIDATGWRLLTSSIEKGVLSLAEGSTDLFFPIPSLMQHLAGRMAKT